MIVAGVLAIVVPPAAGIAVAPLVAWLLIFSGAVHLAFAWYTRTTGGFVWELLLGILYILGGTYLLFHPMADLLIWERIPGVPLGTTTQPDAWFGLAAIRWHRHRDPRTDDLEDVAVQYGMGDRYTCGDQYSFQRGFSSGAVFGRSPCGGQVGVGAGQ